MGKSLIIQGTRADVGKSLLVAGFCRLLHQEGVSVVPFKASEMSTNTFMSRKGFELGRTQIFQAQAAYLSPDQRMNPVIVKQDGVPRLRFLGETIVAGDALLSQVVGVANELAHEYEVVLVEGASTLRGAADQSHDYWNNAVVEQLDAPIILVTDEKTTVAIISDINQAMASMSDAMRQRVKGVLINQQDQNVIDVSTISGETKVSVLGVVPTMALNVDSDDRVSVLQNRQAHQGKAIDVAVLKFKHTSNFTDVHPLEIQPDVSVRYVGDRSELGRPDVVVLPGSNNTMVEMAYLRESGLETALQQLVATGTRLFGICGGYQLLGHTLDDAKGLESQQPGVVSGMGLLAVDTIFTSERLVAEVTGYQNGVELSGYEIHRGQTVLKAGAKPFAVVTGENKHRLDGAISEDNRIHGTYLHGVFDNMQWTRQYLNSIRVEKGLAPITEIGETVESYKNREYNKLAAVLREHVDMPQLMALMQ